jgi:hypothetical protein
MDRTSRRVDHARTPYNKTHRGGDKASTASGGLRLQQSKHTQLVDKQRLYESTSRLHVHLPLLYSSESLNRIVQKIAYLNALFRSPRIEQQADMVLWRIPNYTVLTQLHELSTVNQFRSLVSPVFTLPLGYKFRLRLFMNGVGESRGVHISVYVQMVCSDDVNVEYPFRGVITFVLIDQTSGGQHLNTSIKASGNNVSFQKPKTSVNPENGVRAFASRGSLVFTDTIVLGVAIRFNKLVI